MVGAVGDERAGWAVEAVIERDRSGRGEEACADAGAHAVQGAGAVSLEREEVFAGLKGRLDPLAWAPGAGRCRARRCALGGAIVASKAAVMASIAPGVALVADDDHLRAAAGALKQAEADVAFADLRRGELKRARGRPAKKRACRLKPRK